MARNLLSVGGKTPQKKAVGLSLSEDGQVNISNPKTNYVIGSVVEPHATGYQGVVAVMGVECYASLAANTIAENNFVGSNALRVGSNYLIFGTNNVLRYDVNMSLVDDILFKEESATGPTIQALNVGDGLVAVSLPNNTSTTLNLFSLDKRTLATKNQVTIPRRAGPYANTRSDYASSDNSYLYVITMNVSRTISELKKYDAELNLIESKEINTELGFIRMLGVIGDTVIIGYQDATSIHTISLYDTTTLEQVGSPVILGDSRFRNGFIEGNSFIGVGSTYLVKIDLADTINVIVTRLQSELGATYAPKNISYMNGMIAVVTSSEGVSGSATFGDTLTLLEYDPEYGAKRVYQITNASSGIIFKSHVDELDRVWIISDEGEVAGIKLLSSELVLKGYRVVGG